LVFTAAAIAAAAQQAGDAAALEDRLREPSLDPIAQPGEKYQEQTDADQQQRFVKGRLRDAFHQDQPEGGGDHQSGQNRGQQRIGQETHERVQQYKPVVLQQDEQGQGNTRVVHDHFARPCLAGVPVSEVDERHGEQRQTH
jgi:ribosomal protein L19